VARLLHRRRLIVAAIITPPDVVSQLALAIPMVLLYELGIWAAKLFIKHTKAPDSETETKPGGVA
jgi:sec-independent protein translocase protein TatC